jgi:hypothetical protein
VCIYSISVSIVVIHEQHSTYGGGGARGVDAESQGGYGECRVGKLLFVRYKVLQACPDRGPGQLDTLQHCVS